MTRSRKQIPDTGPRSQSESVSTPAPVDPGLYTHPGLVRGPRNGANANPGATTGAPGAVATPAANDVGLKILDDDQQTEPNQPTANSNATEAPKQASWLTRRMFWTLAVIGLVCGWLLVINYLILSPGAISSMLPLVMGYGTYLVLTKGKPFIEKYLDAQAQRSNDQEGVTNDQQ